MTAFALWELAMTELQTAVAAMGHWTAGAATGDWSALIAVLDQDVTFHVPVDGFIGVRHGRTEAERFFGHLADVLRADLEVTSTLRDGPLVAFEVTVRGVWSQRRFRQALCVVLVIADGRVRAFREYLAWPGGLDD